jgi:hypothetical protein
VFLIRYAVVLVAVLAFVACGEADDVSAPPESVLLFTGTVTSTDGSPIDFAYVSYYDASSEPPSPVYGSGARTHADGTYRMAMIIYGCVDEGPSFLTAGKQGWTTSERKYVTSCFQEVNFVLEPVPPSASGR